MPTTARNQVSRIPSHHPAGPASRARWGEAGNRKAGEFFGHSDTVGNFAAVSTETPRVETGQGYAPALGITVALWYFRNRYFGSGTVKGFITRDPLGYVDGMNRYRGWFVGIGRDPYGFMVDTEYRDRYFDASEELGREWYDWYINPLSSVTVMDDLSYRVKIVATGKCDKKCKPSVEKPKVTLTGEISGGVHAAFGGTGIGFALTYKVRIDGVIETDSSEYGKTVGNCEYKCMKKKFTADLMVDVHYAAIFVTDFIIDIADEKFTVTTCCKCCCK